MRLLRIRVAVTDHITDTDRIITQNIIHRTLSQIAVIAVWVIDIIGVNSGEQGGVRSITQRTPLADESEATVGDRDTVSATNPIVEPCFNVLLDGSINFCNNFLKR